MPLTDDLQTLRNLLDTQQVSISNIQDALSTVAGSVQREETQIQTLTDRLNNLPNPPTPEDISDLVQGFTTATSNLSQISSAVASISTALDQTPDAVPTPVDENPPLTP